MKIIRLRQAFLALATTSLALFSIASLPSIAIAATEVPAEMQQWIQANGRGGYDLYPTGFADSEHIQWAVDNADPHGTIRLLTGPGRSNDYFLDKGIVCINFVGTIQGQGIDTTVIHTLEGYDAEMPFTFYYDRTLGYSWTGQGQLEIGGFKLVVDGPATTWTNHGNPSVEVPGVVFVVDEHLFDLYFGGSPQPWPDTGVDITIKDIHAVGEARGGEGYPWGTTLLWPVDIEFFQGGNINISNVRADQTSFIYLSPLFNSNVEIGNIEINDPRSWAITFRSFGGNLIVRDSTFNSIKPRASALNLNGPYGGDLVVKNIVTNDASALAFFGEPGYPTKITLYDNQIDQPHGAQWGGIEIWDDYAGDDITIFDNNLSSETNAWPAILVSAGNNVHVLDNQVDLQNPGHDSFIQCAPSPYGDVQQRNVGIMVFRGSAVIHDNKVISGTCGIIVQQDATAEVRSNKIMWTSTAISAFDESSVLLDGNNLKHNETDIDVDATSSIVIAD